MRPSTQLLDHFENPRNVGTFPSDTAGVGSGQVGTPASGDVMRIQLRLVDGNVVDARFKTFGCTAAIAATSYATELAIGRTVAEADAIEPAEIVTELALPASKTQYADLAVAAVKAAIADWQQRLRRRISDRVESGADVSTSGAPAWQNSVECSATTSSRKRGSC